MPNVRRLDEFLGRRRRRSRAMVLALIGVVAAAAAVVSGTVAVVLTGDRWVAAIAASPLLVALVASTWACTSGIGDDLRGRPLVRRGERILG